MRKCKCKCEETKNNEEIELVIRLTTPIRRFLQNQELFIH